MPPDPYKAEDFLSPADDNPWMLEAAKDWVYETKGEPGEHNAGINIFAWTEKDPHAAFGVIQTILRLVETDEKLFDQAGTGPLESFLSLCPDDFMELVFQVAEIDPRLRQAFRHVWKCGMTGERFNKVKQYAMQP